MILYIYSAEHVRLIKLNQSSITNLSSRIVTILLKVSICCDLGRNGKASEIVVTTPITSNMGNNNA
jgi:hypothetical protein